MVMAQSLFMRLKQLDPTVQLDALAPGWSLPLLACMPQIAAGLEIDVGHGELALRRRRRIAAELATRGYDQAIILPNSLKSALIPYWAGIPRRTGWLGELRLGLLNDPRRLDKQRLPQMVQRFVALASSDSQLPDELPLPQLHPAPGAAATALDELGLKPPQRPLLALAPGAEYGAAKRWPIHHFAALAERWQAHGGAVWLLGSSRDRATCQALNRALGDSANDLSGRTSLQQVVALLSLAQGVVCNDSGVMHIAAALGRPLVAIYGASDPHFTPPLTPHSRILALTLPCRPCFQRKCPLHTYACLEQLGVEQVWQALHDLQLMENMTHDPK